MIKFWSPDQFCIAQLMSCQQTSMVYRINVKDYSILWIILHVLSIFPNCVIIHSIIHSRPSISDRMLIFSDSPFIFCCWPSTIRLLSSTHSCTCSLFIIHPLIYLSPLYASISLLSSVRVSTHSSMPDQRLICGASDCRREDAEQFNTETRRGSNGLETRVGVERLVECQYINQPVGALFIPYRHNFPWHMQGLTY